MTRRIAVFLCLLPLLSWLGCGGSLKEGRREGTPDFRAAKAEYDKGNYLDAIPDFKAYVEQYPGTDLTDDALYYLGLSYIQEKEYALASAQFDRLLRDFPSSPLQADALLELARCDDLQSHPAPLDQTETQRALTRYNQFVEQNPTHPRVGEAKARIQVLRDRLAEKLIRSGRLYLKLRRYAAAEFYVKRVLREHADSKWAAEATRLLHEVAVRQARSESKDALKKEAPDSTRQEPRRKADERTRGIEASKSPG
ncbi:MAG TPA: outer membrane protein assembly factor BamD [Candidatus Dormibacteraeota bacterium]|nr:outer membrane protein assembly factor BamD [Candidatus Dormibacteraeota bacterium]